MRAECRGCVEQRGALGRGAFEPQPAGATETNERKSKAIAAMVASRSRYSCCSRAACSWSGSAKVDEAGIVTSGRGLGCGGVSAPAGDGDSAPSTGKFSSIGIGGNSSSGAAEMELKWRAAGSSR